MLIIHSYFLRRVVHTLVFLAKIRLLSCSRVITYALQFILQKDINNNFSGGVGGNFGEHNDFLFLYKHEIRKQRNTINFRTF